ncbi:hypothetical protein MBLNU230_g2875t1 [Neophaeotheca triangularis]
MITRRRDIPRALVPFAVASLLQPAICHIEMSWPYPLRSKFNPDTPQSLINYDMLAPLHPSGSEFPCRGYQNDQSIHPVVTYEAGSTYNMSLEGSATHQGGSCQISLSYDNGATFRVIKSMIGDCPLKSTYDFTIPSYAQTGPALLAWSWSNLVGNREFYMNCAAVEIQAGTKSRRRRRDAQSIDDLPFIWKADLTQVNDCSTVEGTNTVYPHPGPDVEYGAGMDSSSPPTIGNCDSPTPFGPAYSPSDRAATPDLSYNEASPELDAQQVDGESPSPSLSISVVEKGVSHATASALPTITEISLPEPVLEEVPEPQALEDPLLYSAHETPAPDLGAQRLEVSDYSSWHSTTTVTVDCEDVVTVTILPDQDSSMVTSAPPMYTTSAPPEACFGNSANCPCNPGYQCRLIGICTWACIADSIASTPTAFVTSRTAPTTVSATATASPTLTVSAPPGGSPQPSQPPPPTDNNPLPPPTNSNRPPYVSVEDLPNRRLCEPGTFICTSEATFYTCDVSSDGDWIYTSPRQVADGMLCLPNLTPYPSNTVQSGFSVQQLQTIPGYYRDDRYVRARPDGDCDVDGSLQCTNEGTQFNVCDHGGWVRMGSVASGTICRNGGIEGI